MSQGGWLACAASRTFIERIRSEVDRERFARRCATVIAGRLRIPQAETLPQVRAIHAGFFANRLGEGRPWTAADASEPPPPPIVVTRDQRRGRTERERWAAWLSALRLTCLGAVRLCLRRTPATLVSAPGDAERVQEGSAFRIALPIQD